MPPAAIVTEILVSQIEWHEKPAQEQQDQGSQHLELGHGDATGGAGTGEPNQVLGTNVGREERSSDEEPARVSARQEIVCRRALVCSLPKRHPDGEAEYEHEVEDDDRPVQAHQQVHCRGSLRKNGPPRRVGRIGPTADSSSFVCSIAKLSME
jgi:hypothetical protein